jgi:hypothetical protein
MAIIMRKDIEESSISNPVIKPQKKKGHRQGKAFMKRAHSTGKGNQQNPNDKQKKNTDCSNKSWSKAIDK